MAILRREITNDYVYGGESATMSEDTYNRVYIIKLYLLGILIKSHTLKKEVKKADKVSKKQIGFGS